MSEELEVAQAMRVLDATPAQLARLRVAIDAEVERRSRSLLAEWADLFRVKPGANLGLLVAGAAVLLFMTPAGALVGAVVRLVASAAAA